MDNKETGTTTWPELGISLYDKLTGRGAQIIYEFDNLEVFVPSSTSLEAEQARWRLNGTLRISTRDLK